MNDAALKTLQNEVTEAQQTLAFLHKEISHSTRMMLEMAGSVLEAQQVADQLEEQIRELNDAISREIGEREVAMFNRMESGAKPDYTKNPAPMPEVNLSTSPYDSFLRDSQVDYRTPTTPPGVTRLYPIGSKDSDRIK